MKKDRTQALLTVRLGLERAHLTVLLILLRVHSLRLSLDLSGADALGHRDDVETQIPPGRRGLWYGGATSILSWERGCQLKNDPDTSSKRKKTILKGIRGFLGFWTSEVMNHAQVMVEQPAVGATIQNTSSVWVGREAHGICTPLPPLARRLIPGGAVQNTVPVA